MRHGRSWRRAACLASLLLVPAIVASCEQPAPKEDLGEARGADFANGGFEDGGAGLQPPLPWTVTSFINQGITPTSPQTRAGLNLQSGGNPLLTLTLDSPPGPGMQIDPDLGAAVPFRWPKYGNKVAIVNKQGSSKNVNSLVQAMTVLPSDVDPVDLRAHVRFVWAPVLEDPLGQPLHAASQKPYYFVQLTNVTQGNIILYQDYRSSGQVGGSGGFKYFTPTPNPKNIRYEYRDWQLVDIDPTNSNGPLAVGDTLKLEVLGAGCSLGDHYGQVYVDGLGSALPTGLFVVGSAPLCGSAGTDLTYTLTYKNTDTVNAASNVIVEFNIPTGTTYQSVSLGSCVATPAAAPSLVTCTIPALPAGASGSYTITVHVKPTQTGLIIADSYDISAGGAALLGPNVITSLTSCCLATTDCSTTGPTQVCDMNTHTCVGKACTSDQQCGGTGAICHLNGICGYGCRGGPNPVGCPSGKVCTSTTSTAGVCNNGCTSDNQCGAATSGIICDDVTHACKYGCRGTGGNSCPAGKVCSSTDATMGTCGAASTTTSSSSSSGGGGCIQDSNCGGPQSGVVCNNPTATMGVCIDGCRGVEGNGCPSTHTCSSTDGNIGTCNATSTTSSSSGSSSSSTTTSSSSSSTTTSSSSSSTTASSSSGSATTSSSSGSATTSSSSGSTTTSSSSSSAGSVTTSSSGGTGGEGGGRTTVTTSSGAGGTGGAGGGRTTVTTSSGAGGAGGDATASSSSSGGASSSSGGAGSSTSSSSSSGDLASSSSSSGASGTGGTGGVTPPALTPSGSGLICAAQPGQSDDGTPWLLGSVALALLGASRRRKARAPSASEQV